MFSAYYIYPQNAPRFKKMMVGVGVGIAVLSGLYFFVSRPIFANETQATFLGVEPEKTQIQKEIEREKDDQEYEERERREWEEV